jgi:hypothetical protein
MKKLVNFILRNVFVFNYISANTHGVHTFTYFFIEIKVQLSLSLSLYIYIYIYIKLELITCFKVP